MSITIPISHEHAHERPHGWRRWLLATNHKDIGTLYLIFSFTMFLSGGTMALLIRSELFEPGLQIMRPEFFNQLTTMHGLIMIFGAIMPAFVGFANWMIPLQVGAADMAFARMNNLSFWLLPVTGQLFFMYSSMLISVPTGVKIFNWTATMWHGSLTFETPMLFAVGFIFVFAIGGFSGLILAIAPVDIALHGTYYVVAHFHYVLVAGSLFGLFAGWYYWSPKWTGWMYNERRGQIHFWVSMISFNVAFFPMHFLGLAGMPRRYADYPAQFTDFNQVATIGAFFFGLAQVYFLFWVVLPTYRGVGHKRAADKPWDGAQGLEWTLPSPAPFHSFEIPPLVE